MRKLYEFQVNVEAFTESVIVGFQKPKLEAVQQYRSYFEQLNNAKLKRLGVRLIDECTSAFYMFQIGTSLEKLNKKAELVDSLRVDFFREVRKCMS
ncbi:hypothetical protein [Priestia megaterium]|uniref:hypothetical protein n=1 Tax=Priestia megaterium TaxID=1404 RepID=UPI002E2090D8|nr:hypothetical protein [Priestia megaterium]